MNTILQGIDNFWTTNYGVSYDRFGVYKHDYVIFDMPDRLFEGYADFIESQGRYIKEEGRDDILAILVGETVPWKVVVRDNEGNPFVIESATIELTDPDEVVTTPQATISGHQIYFSFSPNISGEWQAKFTINISGGYTKIFTSTKTVES